MYTIFLKYICSNEQTSLLIAEILLKIILNDNFYFYTHIIHVTMINALMILSVKRKCRKQSNHTISFQQLKPNLVRT